MSKNTKEEKKEEVYKEKLDPAKQWEVGLQIWRKSYNYGRIIFAPAYEEDGLIKTCGLTKDVRFSSCRDSLAYEYELSINNGLSQINLKEGPKAELEYKPSTLKVMNPGLSHNKMVIGSCKGPVNTDTILKVINAVEQYLDNVFKGKRTTANPADVGDLVVLTIPTEWLRSFPTLFLFGWLVRVGHFTPRFKKAENVIELLLTQDTSDIGDSWHNDRDYWTNATIMLKGLHAFGMHLDLLTGKKWPSSTEGEWRYYYNYGLAYIKRGHLDPDCKQELKARAKLYKLPELPQE